MFTGHDVLHILLQLRILIRLCLFCVLFHRTRKILSRDGAGVLVLRLFPLSQLLVNHLTDFILQSLWHVLFCRIRNKILSKRNVLCCIHTACVALYIPLWNGDGKIILRRNMFVFFRRRSRCTAINTVLGSVCQLFSASDAIHTHLLLFLSLNWFYYTASQKQ